ncbi:PAS domain S-box protein [Anabaena azotica]|uniref:PAS domain S-box protein n=1 Tax=Anabaena azotica TaxID=197653 RepID=UPI0039A5D58E
MQSLFNFHKYKLVLFPNISLRWLLIVPFVVQIVGAVGLVGYFSYRSGQESVNQLTTEIRTQTTNNVVQYLDHYLSIPVLINRINADAFHLGYLKIDNTSQLEKYFYNQLQQFPTVSHIMLGTEQGIFLVANRNPLPSLFLSNPTQPSQVQIYQVNRNGQKIRLIKTLENFNLKSRPWYLTAVQVGKPVRIPIFRVQDNSELSLNSSYPIYNLNKDKLLGVFSAASDLSYLHKFMGSLRIGKTGRVFVIERNGLLIGASTNQLPYRKKQHNGKIHVEQIKAIDSQDTLIKATSRYLFDKFGSFKNINKSLQLDFFKSNHKERQFVQIVPYKDDLGLDWLIVVVVPESDLTTTIEKNNKHTILLCGLTFLTATGMGILTTKWITRPISRISQASQSIARGELNQPLSQDQIITEIKILSTSFNAMSEQIQNSFSRVEVALQESTEKYQILFKTLPIGIAITDKTGKIIEINPASKSIFGISDQLQISNSDIIPDWQLVIRDDGSIVQSNEYTFVKALEENQLIHDAKFCVVHSDNSLQWLSINAAPIPLTNYGVVITYMDITKLQKTKFALRDSEARFRKIALSSPGAIYIIVHSVDGSIYFEYVSSAIEEIHEIKIEDLRQNYNLILNSYHPDDFVPLMEEITRCRKTMSLFHYEWRIITPTGKIKWLQANDRPELRENGDVAWYGITLDVTAYKQAELKTWEFQNFLTSIIENIPNMLFVKDAENLKFVRFNKVGEELLGYTREELIGKSDYDFFPPEEADFFITKDREVIKNGTVVDIPEEFIQTKHQGTRILHTKKIPIFDESGHPKYLLGISEDITEHKQTELTIQQSEARFRRLSKNIPGMIYQYVVYGDGSDKFTYVSPKCREIYEIEPNIAMQSSSNLWKIVHSEDIVELEKKVIASARELQPFYSEHRLIMPDQRLKWIQVSAQPEKQDNGDIIWDGLVIDISDRKQAEIALEIAKEAAEAATKAKSQFLANMSHEIRTPMNGVLGMAQLLSNTNLSQEQKDIVQIIRDSGDSLLVVINDILDFSKIESGMLQLEEHNFSLNTIMSSICSLLNTQALIKDIIIKYSIDSAVPINILGDSSRLRQIFLNLVGNAIKFTNKGNIEISIIKNKQHNTQLELMISIKDTGIGIDKERLDKLFQPFTQADASISRKYGGTGLGLAISKSLIGLMGGRIWVESFGNIGGTPPENWIENYSHPSPTQGSIFYFTIIVQEVSQATINLQKTLLKTKQEALTTPVQLKILLAEDNKINQKVVILLLKQLCYAADIANNGLEALKMLEYKDYDVILMDMQMPVMDGVTATKMIRRSNKPQPWIIALTANALDEDRQTCFDAGMNDFITKPIAFPEMTRALSVYLQNHS